MPSLEEMRRRFAPGAASVSEPESPSGVSVDSLESFYRHAVMTVILDGVTEQLGSANKHTLRGCVTYCGRDWSVRPEVSAALEDAVKYAHPFKPSVDVAKQRASLQVPVAVNRIKAAAVKIGLVAVAKVSLPSREMSDEEMSALFASEASEEVPPPTSRSPDSPRPGGVDLGAMSKDRTRIKRDAIKAAAVSRGVPLGPPPAPLPPTTIVFPKDKRYTLSVDGTDAVMNVGKHKGKSLSDIVLEDGGYLDWMSKSGGDWPKDLIDVVKYVRANVEALKARRGRG